MGGVRRTVRATVQAAGLLLLTGAAVQAQDAPDALEGWVEGRVVGEAGAPVPGVLVELSGPGLVRPLEAVSDEGGRFRLGPAPGGIGYRLRALHVGYAPASREEIAVRAGESTAVELRLARRVVGMDTLRVFASPLRIRRDDTEFTARLDRRAIELLPTPYDPTELVGMTPGAQPGQIWGGAAVQSNVYQFDGLLMTHPGLGGGIIEPSMRWVEAVEVRGLGAGAEHGNFQGGLVNVVTRSGSNLRTGGGRASVESGSLNASNLVPSEIGLETELRREVEADASGPVVRDRLYYFVGGHVLEERRRALSHLPGLAEDFLPWTEDRRALRAFAKLTWEPSFRDRFEASGGLFHTRVDHAEITGYQDRDAAGRLTDPAHLYTLSWARTLGPDGRLEARVAGFGREERLEGGAGMGVPSVRVFAHGVPPVPTYHNTPFHRDRSPASRTAAARWEQHLGGGDSFWAWGHRITAGAELSWGRWRDRWLRNGGMTWRPARTAELDPDDPSTWLFAELIPTDWGGEVDLHARVRNHALFVQDHITVSRHLSFTPGLRFGWWSGDLLPGGDPGRRFRALTDRGADPRVGVTVDPLGTNRLVLKAHWGRYHQGMLAQLFDRVEGGEVFTDRELWYYRGMPPATPGTAYTAAERDAMTSGDPRFTLEEVFRLNETGPVDPAYRQPYMDQWVVGVEASLGDRLKAEVVYVNRANRNLAGLLDRNLESNFHRFVDVAVHTGPGPLGAGGGDSIFLGGEPLVLPEMYVRNDWIRQLILWDLEGFDVVLPPGFEWADTLGLSYEPDLVLTNLPGAERDFHQLQLAVHAGFTRWGASASVVWSRLTGNLNSVTGYEAGTDYEDFAEIGAGPWVRPNEAVNFRGRLPGFSPLEIKLAVHGDVGWGVRAGAFLHGARGERYTPYFHITGLGFAYDGTDPESGERGELDRRLASTIAGQRLFVRPRGDQRYGDRFTLDIRLDRSVPGTRDRLRGTLDIFNLWNADAATDVFAQTNQGRSFTGLDPNLRFGAVRERIQPLTVRLGVAAEL